MKILRLIFSVAVLLVLLVTWNGILFGEHHMLNKKLKPMAADIQSIGTKQTDIHLSDVLKLAIKNSPIVRVHQLNEQISKADLVATQEMYFPQLNISIEKNRKISPSSSNDIPGLSSLFQALGMAAPASPTLSFLATDTEVVSASWNKKDINGILYSLGYYKIKNNSYYGKIQNAGGPFDNWSQSGDPIYIDILSASVTIPVFKDWGRINRLEEDYKQILYEETRILSKKEFLDLLNQIGSTYWDFIGVYKTIRTLQSSVELAQNFVNDTLLRQKIGVSNPIEIKRAESQLALTQQMLQQELNVLSQVENQISIALNMKTSFLNYKPVDQFFIRKNIYSHNALIQDVYRHNQDLALLENGLRQNQLTMNEALNEAKTNLDFTMRYNQNGYSVKASQTIDSMKETKLHDYQLALTLNIPLFDKSTPEKIRKAMLEESRLKIQIKTLRTKLSGELNGVLENIRFATTAINLSSKNVLLIEELLNSERIKFKLGESTVFNISQVQQELIDVKKSKIMAQVQYEKAYLSLLILTTRIFEAYGLNSI